MNYQDLKVVQAGLPSSCNLYNGNLFFLCNYYSQSLGYLTYCKEEASLLSMRYNYNGDFPEYIKAVRVSGNEVDNEVLYNKFRETEKKYGLPETEVLILDIKAKVGNSGGYKDFQALVFLGYAGPISKEILCILLKESVGVGCWEDYKDNNRIVELIFSDLPFYLPKVDEFLLNRVPIEELKNYSCSRTGIREWSKMGFLSNVFSLQKY